MLGVAFLDFRGKTMPFIFLSKPAEQTVKAGPIVGERVPSEPALESNGNIQLIAFMRHVGCPFAEHTVKRLDDLASENPGLDIYLVSHAAEQPTKDWLLSLKTVNQFKLIIDTAREIYGKWGLGFSSASHFLGAPSLLGASRLLFKGIRNRNAYGTRWQRAGLFCVKDGVLLWSHVPTSAEQFALPPSEYLKKD